MATKNNPGEFDCYAKAEPDEPLFTLLARDPTAPNLVHAWKHLRCGDVDAAVLAVRGAASDMEKSGKEYEYGFSGKANEASRCSKAMENWRAVHRPDRPRKESPKFDVQCWTLNLPDNEEPCDTEMVESKEFSDINEAMLQMWQWTEEGFHVRMFRT